MIVSPTFGEIGNGGKVYFVADIAANHDGSLDRAKRLIDQAAKAGANAAKFQHFRAHLIVSNKGFREIGKKIAHQATWSKSVVEVYKEAELPWKWTDELINTCKDNGIDFFSAPYDLEAIEYLEPKMPFFKIGSGDITWKESLAKVSKYGKPIFLATGASDLEDVKKAMNVLGRDRRDIVLMQCNTNYSTDTLKNRYSNISVLNEFRRLFPNAILGLSDHSKSHWSTLAAVVLGARVVEKHFTDDCSRTGPDHAFSLNPEEWQEMVFQTSEILGVLGDGVKRIESNEQESIVVQRRAIRYSRDLPKNHVLTRSDLIALRPCPENGISPFALEEVIGRVLAHGIAEDDLSVRSDFKNEDNP